MNHALLRPGRLPGGHRDEVGQCTQGVLGTLAELLAVARLLEGD